MTQLTFGMNIGHFCGAAFAIRQLSQQVTSGMVSERGRRRTVMNMKPESRFTTSADDGHRIEIAARLQIPTSPAIVFVHGLAGDMNEADDLFLHAANAFAARGYNTVRFDFRGHGQSEYPTTRATLSGELLDITAVTRETRRHTNGEVVFIAASLGAAVTISVLAVLGEPPLGLVFWNPVLNCRKCFVHPGTAWSRRTFGEFERRSELKSVAIGDFTLCREMWNEFATDRFSDDIEKTLRDLRIPAIAFHGEADELVPITITKELLQSTRIPLRSFPGQGHGLIGVHSELIKETQDWISSVAPIPEPR